MTTRREAIQPWLNTLDEVTKLLWDLACCMDDCAELPDRKTYFKKVGRVIASIATIQGDLWDLEPDLVNSRHRPKIHADLAGAIQSLRAPDRATRADVLGYILRFAPPPVMEAVANAASEPEQQRIVREWWDAQPRPFVAVENLDKELDAERRYRRIHAARALREVGAPDLINPATGDVDRETIATWRAERAKKTRS